MLEAWREILAGIRQGETAILISFDLDHFVVFVFNWFGSQFVILLCPSQHHNRALL